MIKCQCCVYCIWYGMDDCKPASQPVNENNKKRQKNYTPPSNKTQSKAPCWEFLFALHVRCFILFYLLIFFRRKKVTMKLHSQTFSAITSKCAIIFSIFCRLNWQVEIWVYIWAAKKTNFLCIFSFPFIEFCNIFGAHFLTISIGLALAEETEI